MRQKLGKSLARFRMLTHVFFQVCNYLPEITFRKENTLLGAPAWMFSRLMSYAPVGSMLSQ